MPVLGHAFVGLATAAQLEPASSRDGRALSPLAAASWVPAVVAVSYVPDVVTQLGYGAGWNRAGLFGHSIALALIGGSLIAVSWARVTHLSTKLLLAVSIGSILGHDFLDLVQSTDRAPFWPWSTRIVSTGRIWLPTGLAADAILFAVLFAIFAAWRIATGRSLRSLTKAPAGLSRARLWTIRGGVVAVIVAAVVAHAVRERLEYRLEVAERLIRRGQYSEALAITDQIDGRWLAAIKPGRVDVVRAEAYEGLGEGDRAETLYRLACAKDPTNFWAAVDLVEYYAASDKPLDERRRLAAPYLAALRSRFVSYRELPAILERIDRQLAPDE